MVSKKIKHDKKSDNVKTIKKLSAEQKYLLWCIEEKILARALAVRIKTLILWRSLGLPSMVIKNNRNIFYNYVLVLDWLKKNIDTVYLKTPVDLLPRTINGNAIIPNDDDVPVKSLYPKDPDLKRIIEERQNKQQASK